MECETSISSRIVPFLRSSNCFFQLHCGLDKLNFFRRTQVELPIHFRYQAPGDSWYKMVDIPAPLVFQQCQEAKLGRENLQERTAAKFPCSVSSEEWCLWEHIDFPFQEDGNVRATIPCGMEGHVAVVVMVTVLVALAGTFYLVRHIISFTSRQQSA